MKLLRNLGLVTRSGKISLDTILLYVAVGLALWALCTPHLGGLHSWRQAVEYVCSNRQ